ncbi:hypothetical protein [Alteraurantiacibacter buctensis]|uniref:Uncharacterized protein n=1 Tax=Alteraurantiacibacter buctensis TaxID=1503981 RepID=A0A844Z4W4_9SPHN|nr:hypothetical protein [Alteraurantiacibacter buctensis]MXO72873.1 hypothetical protein [Alteraurantiacibacter buctensis]
MFSKWELLDDGSWNGIRRWIRSSDEDEGTVQIRSEGVGEEQIIERNKAADAPDKRSEMWHVGSIPASVGLKWLVEEGIDMWNPHHMDAVKRKLMDSDYRHLVPGMARILL